ncbi:MAG: hypothetical protein HY270_24150, partial [Deltaproteobacteria bacterium]|nr:hypothetical protein [Deltaproteobacteria bacterium]
MKRTFVSTLVLFAALLLSSRGVWAAPPCVGDCNGNGEVTIDEITLGINIALASSSIDPCVAMDSNGDGAVTIDEIIAAIFNALNGCPSLPTASPTSTVPPSPTPTAFDALRVSGGCRKPGPHGLVPCDAGIDVTVWRCEDRSKCPGRVEARTRLGDGPTDMRGTFSIAVPRAAAQGALLLMDAPVDNAVLYRVMDFGTVGGGGSRRALDGGGIQPQAEAVLDVTLDPSSEAGVRLLDENDVASFADTGISRVQNAARDANLATVFDGLSPAQGADLATMIARNDPQVQQAIQ